MAPGGRRPGGLAAAYGLDRDPFPDGGPDDFYFATPLLTQQLDMLQNLARYSDALLVVTGVEGSGKTTLLREVVRTAGPRWRICTVAGSPDLSADQLVAELLGGFGLPVRGRDRSAHLELLGAHLADLQRSNHIALVAVDDVHRLGEGARALLMELAAPGTMPRARFLASSPPGSLEAAGGGRPGAPRLHTVELQPLDLDQTEHYLHARLDYAGVVGDNPFDPRTVRGIHGASGGIPGAIHRAARQVLEGRLDKVPTSHKTPSPGSGAGRALRLMVAVVVVSVTATLIVQRMPRLLSGPRDHGPPRETRVPSSLVADAKPEAPSSSFVRETPLAPVSTPPVIVASMAPETSRAAEEPSPANAGGDQLAATTSPAPPAANPETVPGGFVIPPADAQYDVRMYSLAPSDSLTFDVAVVPASTRTPSQRVPDPHARRVRADDPPPVANPGSASVPIPPGVRDLRWLAAQDPSHYVIQLVGSREPAAVGRFLARHALGKQAAWFTTSHDGRPWYVVVYGLYPDRATARSAIASLPEGLRDGNPWARPIAGIVENAR